MNSCIVFEMTYLAIAKLRLSHDRDCTKNVCTNLRRCLFLNNISYVGKYGNKIL